MHEIVYLIERISVGLYFFIGVLILAQLVKLLRIRSELAIASFDMEREIQYKRRASAITWLLLFIEMAAAVLAISQVVAPTMRNDVLLASGANLAPDTSNLPPPVYQSPVPGPDWDITQTALAISGQVQSGPQMVMSPLPSPTVVGTILADTKPAMGCENTQAFLIQPANGQVVFDTLLIEGTANVPEFAFYKFEIKSESFSDEFRPLGDNKSSPVPNTGILGQLSLAEIPPGNYQFRLAVFNNQGMIVASCIHHIQVILRPPTATAPGG